MSSPFLVVRGSLRDRWPLGAGSLRRAWRTAIPAFAGIATILASPLIADDTMPPAPYAYKQLEDPRLEAKAEALMETLRCLVCQGQSIADSDASMAGDMRNQVRLRIKAGEQPEAVRAWLMERYGDYISYKPVLSATTWPLFAVPALLLVVAGIVFARRLRRAK